MRCTLVLGLCLTCHPAAWAEQIVFPPGARVASVLDYGATPDDDTDDTAAFQQALDAQPPNWLIFVPDGTYLIGDTLRWGGKQRRQVLQGQSEAGTIIKLRDNCPGYGDPASPKAMIWTGTAPAQRFRNGLRHLTLDTGTGNPGAVAAQFIANNQGGIQHVTIKGQGPIGLDLGYTDEQGPLLLKHVTVEGFDVGIRTRHAVDSITGEFITLRGQKVTGWYNDGQVVNLRQLRSDNTVPGLHNPRGPGVVTLIDSELTGPGVEGPALINEAAMFARNVRVEGYATAIDNRSGVKRAVPGPVVSEFVSHRVLQLPPEATHPGNGSVSEPAQSLGLPVKETPDVPWDDPADWVSVTDFGPPQTVELTRLEGKGIPKDRPKTYTVDNWAPALQKAIDSGASTIYFPASPRPAEKGYALLGTIRLRGNVRRIIGCEASMFYMVPSTAIKSMFPEEHSPVFILEDGQAPAVVIERFDTWYTPFDFRVESGRTLVIKSLSFHGLYTQPGSGDVFLEDVRCKKLRIEGSRVWGRQVNPEGWEEPRILVSGADAACWILGLKTEGDTTIGHVQRGGRLEVVGGFFYANKDQIRPKQFFINEGGTITATFGEWVTKANAPFDILEERRPDGVRRMVKGDAYNRGMGSMAPLVVSDVPVP